MEILFFADNFPPNENARLRVCMNRLLLGTLGAQGNGNHLRTEFP